MPSRLSGPVRVTPQQARSARMFAQFLQGAAELFAGLRSEATTMQRITKRSGASIREFGGNCNVSNLCLRHKACLDFKVCSLIRACLLVCLRPRLRLCYLLQ